MWNYKYSSYPVNTYIAKYHLATGYKCCNLQEFEQHILEDSRSSSLDKGNIKLTYQSVSVNFN